MSRQVGPTIELLLSRVWERGGAAIMLDTALHMFSRAQRVVNATLSRVTEEGTLTAVRQQTIYAYRQLLPDAINILSVRTTDSRAILRTDSIDDFSIYSETWWRDTGTRIEFWHQLGHDLLILYPAHATASTTLTIVYSKLLTDLTDFEAQYNDDLELADDDVDLALMLAEILLLAHVRSFTLSQQLLEKAKLKLTPYLAK